MSLDREQKRFFEDNGYLLLEQVYSPDEVARAGAEMDRLLQEPQAAHPRVRFSYEEPDGSPAPPENPQRVWMIMDTPLAGDWWFRQACEPRVVDAIGPPRTERRLPQRQGPDQLLGTGLIRVAPGLALRAAHAPGARGGHLLPR